jgi:hypothetical protein
VLDRIEPSVDALIARVEAYNDYEAPKPTIQLRPESEKPAEDDGETEVDE